MNQFTLEDKGILPELFLGSNFKEEGIDTKKKKERKGNYYTEEKKEKQKFYLKIKVCVRVWGGGLDNLLYKCTCGWFRTAHQFLFYY